ncbi:MAG: hypothetical protein ACXQT4_04620, partial [Methanotrichaceae archaeon]
LPVLGLIFLKYADYRFIKAQKKLEGKSTGRRRAVGKTEGEDIGRAIREAMSAIEAENEQRQRSSKPSSTSS